MGSKRRDLRDEWSFLTTNPWTAPWVRTERCDTGWRTGPSGNPESHFDDLAHYMYRAQQADGYSVDFPRAQITRRLHKGGQLFINGKRTRRGG